MAFSVAIPSSPAGSHSPASTTGSNGPQTPSSPSNPPTLALPPPAENASTSTPAATTNSASNNANTKRKPSRRANTAERRATHNAVERARRETLNSRFLDLAALLPNLSQIRRPSKSSIVNSSIAHIHASRRHRFVAARELRLLKLEADALRREINEWRDRSGLPRVEEPVRGEAFQMILSGEVEVLNAGPIEEEDGDEYDDEFVGGSNSGVPPHGNGNGPDNGPGEMRGPMAHAAAVALVKNGSDAGPFSHTPTSGLRLQTMMPHQGAHGNGTPMIVSSPTSVSFENPSMVSMYEPHHPSMGPGQFSGQFFGAHAGDDKAGWQHYPSLSGPGQQPFSPPASSQDNAQQAAYYMNMQRQQAMLQQQRGMGRVFGSPADGDDSSSVGSAPGNGTRRERSGSMGSTGSGYGSPGAGSFDVPRQVGNGNGAFGDGMGMGIGGIGMGVGMMKSVPISVGGGGNGHGYASMML